VTLEKHAVVMTFTVLVSFLIGWCRNEKQLSLQIILYGITDNITQLLLFKGSPDVSSVKLNHHIQRDLGSNGV